MSFISRTFGALRPAYMIRAYVIGAIFFACMVWLRLQTPDAHGNTDKVMLLIYLFVCTLLFPFAKLIWDELRNVALGSNFFVMNAVILVFLKLLVNMMLWFFAVFVAPLGVLYLWYRSREVSAPGE